MFGDDPFSGIEDLFNQLAGGKRYVSQKDQRHSNQRLLNTIESKKETIFIFDLSGKKIINVSIEDDFDVDEYGDRMRGGKKILLIRFDDDEVLKYDISKDLAKRKIDYTFINGILEVSLKR